jgi:hypothetical protein
VLEQRHHSGANEVDGRLVARDQQKQHHGDRFVWSKAIAGFLRLD